MAILNPFQLLEINIISAQDLEVVSKKMKTYATAWVNPSRKLTTRVDAEGHNNPTWNDKFVFRVDDEFLRQDTSAVMIEIYGVHWFRDTLVGTVRVLVGNLIPPPMRPQHHHHHHIGMRFVALQVRRPSGRPQGILNIGVALLDSSMRSMPLYRQLSKSAVGYRDLMGEEDPHQHHNNHNNNNNVVKENVNTRTVKPILLRSKSERSERVTFDNVSVHNSSIVAVPQKKGALPKESSILSISEVEINPFMNKKGKASSVISGAELREKPRHKGKKGKAGSVLSDSIVSKDSSTFNVKNEKPKPKPKPNEKVSDGGEKIKEKKEAPTPELNGSPTNKVVDEKSVTEYKVVGVGPPPKTIGKSVPKYIGYDYGGPKSNGKFVLGGPTKANSIWSDSEVGPSPSEVAAAMAERKYPLQENRSVVSDGWSMDESVEGLRSKLERWRTELPPIYDRGFSSSYRSTTTSHRARRHSDGGSGLFSCFGNIYGYECQCICGKPPGRKTPGTKFHQSPSIGSRSFL